LSAEQVAAELFGGHVSPLWVMRNVPGKIKLGHVKRGWWEYDVRRWLESLTPSDGEAA
jgi:predicted DNA-binding transcriptional regulator AlpA